MSERLWLMAAALCAALLLPAGPGWCPAAERPSAEQKIEEELGRSTQLEFVETPLQDVIDYLKRHHKIEIQVDRKALDDVGLDPSTIPITKRLKGISLRSALNLMLRDLDLTYLVADEVLLITTPEEAEVRLTTKFYRVGDLVGSGNPEEQRRRLQQLVDAILGTREPGCIEPAPGLIAAMSFCGVPTLAVAESYQSHRQIAAFLEGQRRAIRAGRRAVVPRCRVVDIHRTPAMEKLEKALMQPTEFSFVETPLQDVVDYLKKKHKIEIQIDRKGLEDVGLDPSTIPITKRLKGLTLRSALRLMLRDLDLSYLVGDEVLLITTPEEAEVRLRTKIYAAGDLGGTFRSALGYSGFPGWTGTPVVGSRSGKEKPAKDTACPAEKKAAPPLCGAPRPTDVPTRGASLIELIAALVEPTSWDCVGGPGSIAPASFRGVDVLVVSNTDEAHEEIARLLETLREFVCCNQSIAGPAVKPAGDKPTTDAPPKAPPPAPTPAKKAPVEDPFAD